MCRPCRTMTLAGILIDFCTLLDDLHSAVFAHIHGYILWRLIHDTAVTRVTVCRTVNSVLSMRDVQLSGIVSETHAAIEQKTHEIAVNTFLKFVAKD